MKPSLNAPRDRKFMRPTLPLPLPAELLLNQLQKIAHFLLSAGVNRASVVYLLARTSEVLGRRSLAARLYARALRLADESTNRKMFKVRQLWEFLAERNSTRRGQPKVKDPLFHHTFDVNPKKKVDGRERRRAPGYYDGCFTHRGLRIDGYFRLGVPGTPVELLVNERVVARKLPTKVLPGLFIFVFGVWRDALEMMPTEASIRIRVAGGSDLLRRGSPNSRLRTPHCRSGEAKRERHWRLDKKGFLLKREEALHEMQNGFLRTYEEVSAALHAQFGIQLFILYGTLLGQQRSRDFIPGDDDFDVGYFSSATDSKNVRAEGIDIAIALVRKGFIVTLNRDGRLFRVRLPGMPPSCHLDVHAVWVERGSLWIHPRSNLSCTADDFLPAKPGSFREREVLIPAKPEVFLEAYYGRSWRTPDPSYSTAARSFPEWKSRHLARSFISPLLAKEMYRELDRSTESRAPGGRLIVTGLHPLYPLERYERDCDW